MQLAQSLWLKVLITAAAATMFVWLLEATILDSRHSMLPERFRAFQAAPPPDPLPPGARASFAATAYCKGPVTSAGVTPKSGVAASDPALLPLGSIIQLDVDVDQYDGIYSVLDTGPAVKGREVDIYIWSCHEALRFGRRSVQLTVLRRGWNPAETAPAASPADPTLMERLFRRRPR
jgi:3D (Asp-Asp-Asp) domain-containing protein